MKLRTLSLLAAAALFSASCSENEGPKDTAKEMNEQKMDDTPAEKMESDADWAVDAASGGMLEVQLGELAQKNGVSQGVKDFGKMMATDHSKANEELKSIAAAKNITLPAMMGNDDQKTYDDLAKKTGTDFDKAYMSEMVDDHESDVKEFKKEASDGKDAELKAFAAKMVPTLEQHLQMAKSTKDMVK